MHKIQHGGKEGVQLFPNHFTYVSEYERNIHISVEYFFDESDRTYKKKPSR